MRSCAPFTRPPLVPPFLSAGGRFSAEAKKEEEEFDRLLAEAMSEGVRSHTASRKLGTIEKKLSTNMALPLASWMPKLQSTQGSGNGAPGRGAGEGDRPMNFAVVLKRKPEQKTEKVWVVCRCVALACERQCVWVRNARG